MNRKGWLSVTGTIAALVLLVGCGETIDLRETAEAADAIDTAELTAGGDGAGTADPSVIDADASATELLPVLVASWQGLGQRVIDNDAPSEALQRIEELWRSAEPQVRAERPDLLFGFEQAVDLARSSVERRRPADASKGYKLAVDLTNDYLDS